jgi:ribose 5-phosphate isomerase B
MKIAIATDHNGVNEKQEIIKHLEAKGIEILDLSTDNTPTDDYPEFAFRVAKSVINNECNFGILLCGTGIGMSIAANKVKGIRAACCSDYFSAKLTRMHNDANVLCMGERVLGAGLALDIVDIFINTPFEGGRHQTRVDMIMALEAKR